MNRLTRLVLAVGLTASAGFPCMAQDQISNNQPVGRSLSARELALQTRLKLEFKNGAIDSTQLASLQRDFDGILVRESRLKTKGLTTDGRESVDKALDEFETRLNRNAGKRPSESSTTVIEKDSNNVVPPQLPQ